ncbi:MAG: hypothetical protein EBU90_04845 [Proteobacteria bacterium]|nr:hypothetical protein [Pseudomonadota bacterium]NBP13754.1 hypothetical protein [bacterium]
MKYLCLLLLFIIKVTAEGYYCPYSSLGYDGKNDLLYDYYQNQGNVWIRIGRTGWETRTQYCRAKGDFSLHSDASQAKCQDSQGTCQWNGNSCEVNPNKKPDCFQLCQTVLSGGGLSCLGNDCPGGPSNRETLYAICQDKTSNANANTNSNTNSNTTTKMSFQNRSKLFLNQCTCYCESQ